VSSPLGKYASVVAAIAALVLIGAWILGLLLRHALGLVDADLAQLQNGAFIATGAVFGAAASVNGWKQPLTAFGTKLDAHTAQIGVLATAVVAAHPEVAPAIAAVVDGSVASSSPAP
jgi:hypothetical protein